MSDIARLESEALERLAAIRLLAVALRDTPDEAATAPEFAWDEGRRRAGEQLLAILDGTDPPEVERGAPHADSST